MMNPLVFAVPSAGEIQYGDDEQPHQVDAAQAKAKSRRLEKEGLTICNDLAGFVTSREKHDDVQYPDQVNM